MIPQTYEEWLRCIAVECGIPLTPDFVHGRLTIWKDEQSEETRRFRRYYGDRHWRSIINWFEQTARLIDKVR